MCNKTPKRETEVLRDPFDPLNLPPGRDWSAAPVTFDYYPDGYSADMQNLRRESIATALEVGIGKGLLVGPAASLDALSAPPRASRWQQVGLVLGAGWDRLCKRKEASCAIIVAALILGAVALVLSGLSHVIGG